MGDDFLGQQWRYCRDGGGRRRKVWSRVKKGHELCFAPFVGDQQRARPVSLVPVRNRGGSIGLVPVSLVPTRARWDHFFPNRESLISTSYSVYGL
jgi:hypothetical protein